jgi:hypothetical protein
MTLNAGKQAGPKTGDHQGGAAVKAYVVSSLRRISHGGQL